jgi:hypothetical protein
MRRDHLAPRLKPPFRLPFRWHNCEFSRLRPRLFIEADPQQLLLAALDLGSLFRGNGAQQPVDAVERAIAVVGRERLLMRPIVARIAQLLDEVALRLAEFLREHRVPLSGRHGEQCMRVPVDRALGVARKAAVAE